MLNEALRLIRVYHDLNKSEVAERVDLSKSYITELESGDKKVTLEVLQKYAAGFNIPLSSLLFFAERASNSGPKDGMRVAVASKVIKMLDWIAAVTADRADGGAKSHAERAEENLSKRQRAL